jgi:acyl-coenzyme A thioesterase PaaI-like protein
MNTIITTADPDMANGLDSEKFYQEQDVYRTAYSTPLDIVADQPVNDSAANVPNIDVSMQDVQQEAALDQTVTTDFTIAITDRACQLSNDGATGVVATYDDTLAAGVAAADQAVQDNAIIEPFSIVPVTEDNAEQIEIIAVTPSSTAAGVVADPNEGSDGNALSSGVYTLSGSAAVSTMDLRDLAFTPTPNLSALVDAAASSWGDAGEAVLGEAFSGVKYASQGPTVAGSSSTGPAPVFVATSGGIKIDLVWDAAALAAPASFRTDIEQAATMLSASISNQITVNINIDYSGTGGGAAAGPDSGIYESYSSIRADLINDASPGDTTFNSLPSGSSIQGQSLVAVWNAQLKVFGLLPANSTTTDDGSATFATDIDPNLLVGVALHELTHAMGRVPYGPEPDIFDFYRFTSPGTRLFSGSIPAPPAYFSVDGGVTKLADYGENSDPSDFLNTGVQGANDPFNEYYTTSTLQQLTAVDLKELDALGFDTTPPGTPGTPPTISGTQANQRVNDNSTLKLFAGVAVADTNANQTETVTVTFTGANGALSDPNQTSDRSTSSSGSYTVSGTVAQVTVDLDDLVFTPTVHQVAPSNTVTTGFTIAVADTAGQTASNSTTSVVATAIAVLPTIGGAKANQSVNDNATIKPFSAVTVADTNFGQTETVSITFTGADGALSDPNSASDHSTIGSGSYTVTGTAAQVTADLDSLVFTPTAHQVAPGSTVTTGFTIRVTDTAGETAGNSTTSVIATAVSVPAVTIALAHDTGFSSTDNITSNDTLTGSGDPNAMVHFKIDGTAIATTVSAGVSGVWTYAPTGLADGTHTIVASETNALGNTGSASLTFTLDTTPPTATIATEVLSGGRVTLTGSTGEANDTISVYDGISLLGTATTSSSGGWSFTTGTISNTVHTYTVTATDLAGNIGHSSNEAIVGSTNADTIVGNGGNDLIIGGGGADVLTGGAGHVTFIYDAATDSTPAVHETITDFASSRDIINFTTIAGINATGGIATFQGMLSGSGHLSLHAHSVAYIEVGGNTEILVNTTSNTETVTSANVSAANMEIVLVGIHLGLTSSDFHHA